MIFFIRESTDTLEVRVRFGGNGAMGFYRLREANRSAVRALAGGEELESAKADRRSVSGGTNSGAMDSEFGHPGFEGCGFKSECLGGALGTANSPA